jgi:hypothetical protein
MGRPNPQNLIPANKRTPEERRRIASLGGKANKGNPNTIFAAKLRELKKRTGKNDTDIQWFIQCLDNPRANVMDMLKHLDEAKEEMPAKDYILMRNQLHRTLYGDKIHIQQTNININMEMNKKESDELLELLRENT